MYLIYIVSFVHNSYLRIAVHAAASVNIQDETWNSVFDRPHDALEDIVDINDWSDVEETALAHDRCMHQDIDNSDGRDTVESQENGVVESEQCFQDKDDDSATILSKDDDSAFVKDDDSVFVRDDDSAFVKDNDSAIVRYDDSAIVRDDDSAFVRDESKLPKPSWSWSQPQTIIKVEERSTEDKKILPCEMTIKPSEEE